MDIRERFEQYVHYEPMSGCHLWGGASDDRPGKGYGFFGVDGKNRSTHRVAYELYVGPISEGLHVRHTCDTPACVNPIHLELGTNRDNQQDKVRRGRHPGQKKTHCKWGHLFDLANTYYRPDGRRLCRTCNRNRAAARAA